MFRATKAWRLRKELLRLSGGICPRCGGKSLFEKVVCPQCGQRLEGPNQEAVRTLLYLNLYLKIKSEKLTS